MDEGRLVPLDERGSGDDETQAGIDVVVNGTMLVFMVDVSYAGGFLFQLRYLMELLFGLRVGRISAFVSCKL